MFLEIFSWQWPRKPFKNLVSYEELKVGVGGLALTEV